MRLTAAITLSFLTLAAPALASQVVFDPLTGRPVSTAPSGPGGRAAATPIPRETVNYAGPHRPGTIVVNTAERRLYLVMPGGKAVKYGVGVGRPGFAWGGSKAVTRKAEWPSWTPPSQMLKRRPDLPRFMPGGPENPMGARALYLGSSLFRIHGSNEPETIGQAVSSGCIRMLNEDVIDLYNRVRVGTQVVVMR
jgi:lipoprotein-anchoring transpeptidase ErfK/SrfK